MRSILSPRTLVTLLVLLALLPAVGAAQSADAAAPSGPGFWRGVGHTVGSAIVGGWVGWVGAQVAVSDWEKADNGDLRDQRTEWVAGGVVVGVVLSRLLDLSSASSDAHPEVSPLREGRSNYLTRDEIQSVGGTSAYDVVRALRQQWLVVRGVTGGRDYGRVVYLDDVRLGGVETLQEVAAWTLYSMELLSLGEAALRYGAGHPHGVIQLWTGPRD